jgi:hypothetical protein
MADCSLPDTRIIQLAERISRSTANISQYLHEHGLSFPSFEANAPEELPKELESARLDVLEATCELGQLMLGAREALYLKAVIEAHLAATGVIH